MGMIVSESMTHAVKGGSLIRKMFEEGNRLKAELGDDKVCDFSLGNPLLDPPEAFHQALKDILSRPTPRMHAYIPNGGLPEARQAVAGELARETGLPFEARHVVMTCGAGGGLNIVLKALLDPLDDVLCPVPYFVEYDSYAANHGGRIKRVPTDKRFQVQTSLLEEALSPRTKALLINSPNNPTGVVYPKERLEAIAEWLRSASERQGRPILLISDEPYRKLVYDGVEAVSPLGLYENTIVVTSYSKDLGLAGERIGYVAVHPHMKGGDVLLEALVLANRILGFVNAPLLVQRALPFLMGQTVDVARYQALRDRIMNPLLKMGYTMARPQGAFYLFPETPGGDEVAFMEAAWDENLLIVPGSAFVGVGHFRLCYAVEEEVIDRSLPLFEKLFKRFGGK